MELLRIQILLSNDMCMRHQARMRSFGQERVEVDNGMQIWRILLATESEHSGLYSCLGESLQSAELVLAGTLRFVDTNSIRTEHSFESRRSKDFLEWLLQLSS